MRRILEEEAENRMIRVHTYALARIRAPFWRYYYYYIDGISRKDAIFLL